MLPATYRTTRNVAKRTTEVSSVSTHSIAFTVVGIGNGRSGRWVTRVSYEAVCGALSVRDSSMDMAIVTWGTTNGYQPAFVRIPTHREGVLTFVCATSRLGSSIRDVEHRLMRGRTTRRI